MKFLAMLLDTAGPHAEKTAQLFWFIFSVEAVIFVLVLGFLFFALWRRRTNETVAPLEVSIHGARRLILGVGIAVISSVLILTVFVGVSYAVDRQLIDFDTDPALEIEVTAHQWWWEIRYSGKTPSEIFVTANEIHVPSREKVRLILKSNDVIHSLWFPNLSGKRDIIPGRDQDLVIRADREGTWLGRCGEFCGLQHAFMGLTLIAESAEKFETWKMAQRKPAADPMTDEEKRGQKIFTSASCMLCHTIRGTSAAGYSSNAPDLTHLKSRSTIGAGVAENTKGHLGGWILDPHGLKPGVHMPAILQEPQDFQALLNYLEILK